VKIIENNLGKSYMRMLNVVQPIQMVQPPTQPPIPAPTPPQLAAVWQGATMPGQSRFMKGQ
jgi:hypothetical protein